MQLPADNRAERRRPVQNPHEVGRARPRPGGGPRRDRGPHVRPAQARTRRRGPGHGPTRRAVLARQRRRPEVVRARHRAVLRGGAGTVASSKLSYQAIESLWTSAGGSKALAPVMAAIAIAESGGRPDAL